MSNISVRYTKQAVTAAASRKTLDATWGRIGDTHVRKLPPDPFGSNIQDPIRFPRIDRRPVDPDQYVIKAYLPEKVNSRFAELRQECASSSSGEAHSKKKWHGVMICRDLPSGHERLYVESIKKRMSALPIPSLLFKPFRHPDGTTISLRSRPSPAFTSLKGALLQDFEAELDIHAMEELRKYIGATIRVPFLTHQNPKDTPQILDNLNTKYPCGIELAAFDTLKLEQGGPTDMRSSWWFERYAHGQNIHAVYGLNFRLRGTNMRMTV